MLVKEFSKDKLKVKVYASRQAMGQGAAHEAVAYIKELLDVQPEVNIIFAAAPSQNEFLAAVAASDLEWGRINAFHMDEYIGLKEDAPQGFGNFLRRAIFDKVPFRSVHYLNGLIEPSRACAEYAELLEQNPVDVVFMGIGENGHIAFNDPHVANFNDAEWVKVVDLDEKCRQQQVNDGCFATIDDVPTHAMTLTIPTLCRAKRLFCVVPAPTKAWAVNETINGEVSEHCPASIMRCHDAATLYVDNDSSSLLK
ncbi:MAG: glucosamine-6-phosphate deaminase [Alistipes sp.]|nr:glucosamine-6-phosphate deaminase [Alistipes sp.]